MTDSSLRELKILWLGTILLTLAMQFIYQLVEDIRLNHGRGAAKLSLKTVCLLAVINVVCIVYLKVKTKCSKAPAESHDGEGVL